MCVAPEKGWEGQEQVRVSVSAPTPISSLCFQPRPGLAISIGAEKSCSLLSPTRSPRVTVIPFGAPFLWLGREGSGWAHTPQCPVSLGLGLQYPLAFALSFSRWLCTHPELYRLLVELNSVGPLVPGDLIAKGSLVSS